MSITPPRNFDTDRMQTRTLTTLVSIAEQYETKANNTPSVAYDSSFWQTLQQALQKQTRKYRQLAQAGAYTSLTAYLRDLEQYGIPLAIGRARNRVENGDPHKIETTEFWHKLYTDIKNFETTTPSR